MSQPLNVGQKIAVAVLSAAILALLAALLVGAAIRAWEWAL